MAEWILNVNDNVTSRNTLNTLHTSKLHIETWVKEHTIFNALIDRILLTSINIPSVSIEKPEIHNVGISFKILENYTSKPAWLHKLKVHIVFNAKFHFTINARLVLYGYKTHDTIGSTYPVVLSRESPRIYFV